MICFYFNNAATTIIDGGGLDRVFHILGGTVDISGLTIQNGSTGGDLLGGAGIRNEGGTLTLNNSTVSGNTACQGAGIFNEVGATLTITSSAISGNTNPCGGQGGGIRNNGTLTLTNSTVSGNAACRGGGIMNGPGGFGTLSSDTVSSNQNNCDGSGGPAGIASEGNTFTLKDTIIADNTDPGGPFGNCEASSSMKRDIRVGTASRTA